MFQSVRAHAPVAAVAAMLGFLSLADAAQAHAHLVSSTPAANSAGPAPAQITLKFNEALLPRFSGVVLTTVAGAATLTRSIKTDDKNTLAIASTSPLKPGAYLAKWHAVAADTHRTQGAFSFRVR